MQAAGAPQRQGRWRWQRPACESVLRTAPGPLPREGSRRAQALLLRPLYKGRVGVCRETPRGLLKSLGRRGAGPREAAKAAVLSPATQPPGGLLWGLEFQSNHTWSIKFHAPGFSLPQLQTQIPCPPPLQPLPVGVPNAITGRGWFPGARPRTVGAGHSRVCGEPHCRIILLC